jgi:hypothetical protein
MQPSETAAKMMLAGSSRPRTMVCMFIGFCPFAFLVACPGA